MRTFFTAIAVAANAAINLGLLPLIMPLQYAVIVGGVSSTVIIYLVQKGVIDSAIDRFGGK